MVDGVDRTGMFLCLVSPSGGGKTTLAKRLLAQTDEQLQSSISCTSRPARAGEQEGVEYHFLNKEDFQERIDKGEFFEWEEVHGEYYGTLRSTLDEAKAGGIDLLLDIDIRGALSFKEGYPNDTVICFLVAPSMTESIRRIQERSQISGEEIEARLKTAEFEFDLFLQHFTTTGFIDYFIVNKDLDESFGRLKAIVAGERLRLGRLNREQLVERVNELREYNE